MRKVLNSSSALVGPLVSQFGIHAAAIMLALVPRSLERFNLVCPVAGFTQKLGMTMLLYL